MTTSILNPCAGHLHGNDLQAVRDFALEAPYEWRKALEGLCDVAEEQKDVESLEADIGYLQEAGTDAVKEIRAALEEFYTTKFTAQDRTDFAKTLKKSLKDLELAVKP